MQVCTIDMRMQNNIFVIATVVLVLGIFISTIDASYEESSPDVITSDLSSDSDYSCDLCLNSSKLYHIAVLRGNKESKELYMFVDILSTNTCCNVVANRTWYLTDVRGKRS